MLVRVKYTRNGVNITKDLKNIKRPHFMNRCPKPRTSYSQGNDVVNSKGLPLRNGQKPARGCLAEKRCRKPKRPLAAKRLKNRLGDARSFGVKTDKMRQN